MHPEGDASWQKAIQKRKPPEEKKKERKDAIESAFDACSIDEDVTIEALAEYMGVTERTVWNRIKEHKGFKVQNKIVTRK